MNALVSVRDNFAGIQGLTPEKRLAAAKQISANAQAKALATAKALMKAATAAGDSSAAKAAAATKAAGADGKEEESKPKQELGRDAFLSLLVMQMQNQDPLAPVDNSQMIAQLAQFSALEQMNNLNESFQGFSDNFNQLSFITAGNLVGKNVTGTDSEGVAHQGKVERTIFDQGSIYLYVDGQRLALSDISNVSA